MANTQLQLQTGFIDRLADTDIVPQRITDGYFNATAMCRSAGKKIHDYGRLSTTKAFLTELSSVTGIPSTGKIKDRPRRYQHQGQSTGNQLRYMP